ncbi:MAG: hypothetical protein IT555_01335, partial [Acetobacteraceae bacterium]|nr:hypothetical protein [Acetobacteraceae bacterium]
MARGNLYELTPDHRAQLKPWADKWIANAMSTQAMTEQDRDICRDAVVRLYRAAGKPPPEHIVFVPSPFVLSFAAGFASAIWHRWAATGAATWDATGAATRDATGAATRDATWAATGDATWAATRDATGDATWDATRDATRAATRDATGAATWDATRDATRAATWDATGDATGDATRDALNNWYFIPADMRALARNIGVGDFGLQCAAQAWKMWHGGNQWSGYDSYLSFFRHVAELPIDYTAWDAWETLSLHSGPRIVHDKFCMISDRPALLTVDDQNRPHADSAPFCRWRDGSALYSVHGTRIPAWVIEQPDRLTVAAIDAEENVEVRRIMLDRYGWAKFMQDSGAKRIDHDERWGTLYRREIADDEPLVMVEVINRSPEPDG